MACMLCCVADVVSVCSQTSIINFFLGCGQRKLAFQGKHASCAVEQARAFGMVGMSLHTRLMCAWRKHTLTLAHTPKDQMPGSQVISCPPKMPFCDDTVF